MAALLMLVALLSDVPDELHPVLAKLHMAQSQAEKQLQARILELRKTQGKAMKASRERADAIAKELAQAKRGAIPIIPIGVKVPLEIGSVGTPESRGGTVLQVLGPNEMLVEHGYRVEVTKGNQIGNIRFSTEPRSYPIMLRGVPTNGHATGQPVILPEYIYVSGNKTYRTPNGSTNTVLVVEPLPVDEIKKHWAAYLKSSK